jgi:hypothetical protein
MDIAAAVLPWIIIATVIGWRGRGSRHLNDESATAPHPPPLLTIVIPARDEARNIERCLRSVLTSTYPALDVIVVDDHSADATGELARTAAAGDDRVRIIVPPALPAGWFGKSWACFSGAAAARGTLLCFIDADTTLSADLFTRLVNARASRDADLISVAGHQELGTFWERVLQPQIFTMLLARFGSTERVNASRRAIDKIANGQCILVRKDAYDAIGGHGAVRDKVAEDLMLAQTFFRAGRRVALVIGLDQLSTRMYTSLSELVRGWRKNIYAGGADAMPFGWFGRVILLPLMLVTPSVLVLLPPIHLMLGLIGVGGIDVVPPAVATALLMAMWAVIARGFRISPWYGVAYPLGAVVLLYIIVTAVARGRAVAWKGREYTSG